MSAFGLGLPAILYPIIDPDVCRARGLDPAAMARACLAGGALLLQLRCKSTPGVTFLALAERLVLEARPYGAALIVNDRADIARLSGAAGVHVGQEDLPVDDVRAVAGATAVVGLSTHDRRQVDEAVAGRATYVAVGPIFGTVTKDTGYAARGLDLVRYAAGRGKPVVAIGGITLDRVDRVVEAGASAVAVIGDLLAGGDPEARTREFIARLGGETGDRRQETE
jgi:thiamine-phosphate pyrophosphorylase